MTTATDDEMDRLGLPRGPRPLDFAAVCAALAVERERREKAERRAEAAESRLRERDHDGQPCTAEHPCCVCDQRDAALAKLARLEAALREIADGQHGEYCDYRNEMLTMGGKTECYSDCPVSRAKAALAGQEVGR